MGLKSMLKALEDKMAFIAGFIAISGAVLHTLGFISLQFWFRSIGMRPNLNLLSEAFFVEGSRLVVYLATTASAPILVLGPVALGILGILRRNGRISGLLSHLLRFTQALSPPTVLVLGLLWGFLTIQLVLRHVLHYRHVAFRGIPCEPTWLRTVGLSNGPVESLFFSVLILIPILTLWFLNSLPPVRSWRHPILVFSAVALVQIIMVPVHYGVLVGHNDLPRVTLALSEHPSSEVGSRSGRTWEVYRTEEKAYLMTLIDGQPPLRRLISIPTSEIYSTETLAVDSTFEVLSEGRTCR